MLLAKIRQLLRGTRPAPEHDVPSLAPRREFETALELERRRAERTGRKFSVLVLASAEAEWGADHVPALAAALEWRLRTTDTQGWFDDRRIGVLLPDTPEVEAWKVADDLERMVGTRVPHRCEVFVYPSYEPPPRKGSAAPQAARPMEAAPRPATAQSPTACAADAVGTGRRVRPVQPLEMLFVRPIPVWKRSCDVIGAVAGLVLLSPLLAATALAVKLTSRGPVLFVQQREGLGGRPFAIWKFRTMVVDAEALKEALRKHSEQDGPAFKLKHDPRITPVGRWLRKTCIDELPQLWNVLKGDMSLVGPRPLECGESAQVSGWSRRRLEVTPGLTCIWQVYGKSRVSFTEWMRMDIRYMSARTFLQDARLIAATAWQVLLHRGSH
jgi:lipopolysaccharide/colanic/teichoic acid biosynthesis glycosyltransferase